MDIKIKKVVQNETINLEDYDFVYMLTESNSTNNEYLILKNNTKLTEEEIVDLIYPCLNFGYRFNSNSVSIYTD